MTDKQLLEQALEALEHSHATEPIWKTPIKNAITAIRARLEKPEHDHMEDNLAMVAASVQELVAQDVQEKCRLEVVPAKGGLLPTPPAAPVQEPNIGALGMPVNVPVTAPGSASRSADSAKPFCQQCHGLGYYDEGHENDDGSMSGGNYVDCEKCKAPVTADNTEAMLIDAMRSTMAVAWGYLWHITTSDKRVIGARQMLLDMIEASGLTPDEFHKIKTYGIHTAKAEGCVANMRETNWMG